MIVTHPYLFNIIVILFIAFTSGWVVFVAIGRRAINLKHKMDALKNEKENLRQHAAELEEQLQKRYTKPLKNTPVISFSSSVKSNKSNDAGA
jgi:cytochrome c-type biogenesis protein CcmH/NrfG